MIQFGLQGVQTDFDVAQTGPVRQLGERHAQELIETRKLPSAIIAFVLAHAPVEIALRQEVHDLRKQKLAGVHCQVLSTGWRGKDYAFFAGKVEIDTREKPS